MMVFGFMRIRIVQTITLEPCLFNLLCDYDSESFHILFYNSHTSPYVT